MSSVPQPRRVAAPRDGGRSAAYAVLDDTYEGHLAFVVYGEPRILSTLIVRVADTVYLHGATSGLSPLIARQDQPQVCLSVDGLVLARSQAGHATEDWSVVVDGTARLVADPGERARVLDALADKFGSGRAAGSRPPTGRELAETILLALPLTELSVEARTGGVAAPVPAYPRAPRSPWLSAAHMAGEHVILEPLGLGHVPELLAATADDEVWQHLHLRRPADVVAMTAVVADALHDHKAGVRVPWVQRDARTGAIAGTTSYYDISDRRGSVAVGHTIIGRPWWRTGLNTEAKLLLLTRAFDELSAERVEWHVDSHNQRSQNAVTRLGAMREGLLRHHHRCQTDNSPRDMVVYSMTAKEWPAARARLNVLLRSPA